MWMWSVAQLSQYYIKLNLLQAAGPVSSLGLLEFLAMWMVVSDSAITVLHKIKLTASSWACFLPWTVGVPGHVDVVSGSAISVLYKIKLTASSWACFLPGTVGVPGHVDVASPHLPTAQAVDTML